MKTSSFRSQRGSVLVGVTIAVMILWWVTFSVLQMSSNTYKLTMRNELRAEARAVAESELEYLLYQFKTVVVSQTAATASAAPAVLSAICDNTIVPTTLRDPFLHAHTAAGWKVRRSMVLENAPFTGTIPGTTKVGTFTYVTARVEVIPPSTSLFANVQTVRVGRRFINSNTTLFQFSIFFQGDLELNPGSDDTVVNGDVVANGNIYMGPAVGAGATLKLNGKVRYLTGSYFNTLSDKTTATYANPTAPPPPVTLGPPIDKDGNVLTKDSAQAEEMKEAENLLGGIDAAAEAKNRPELFGPLNRTNPAVWTDDDLTEAVNNVYRSIIVPPPSASGGDYPNANTNTADDNVITVRRAYSRADLIVTVDSGAVTVTKVVDGVSTNVTSQFSSAITAPTNVWDEREGKLVATTKVNVGTLKTLLDNARASTDPSTYFDFQGLLYVNVKGSSSSTPAGVRLTNAESIPYNATTGVGFSVATNGGLYVQGSYNTSPLKDAGGNEVMGPDGKARAVPAMLLGDALTLLSTNWTDSTTSRPLTSRVAGLSATEIANGGVTVNAGLLTGNRASTTGGSSGGAQNLVRYLEDWSSKSIVYNGSVGRLFSSTSFIAPYANTVNVVYKQPKRLFSFDSNIPTHPPPGNPTTTAFGRGDFFTW